MKDKEFIEIVPEPKWLRWWKRADRVSGRILAAPFRLFSWIARPLLLWVGKGVNDVIVQLRRAILGFAIRVALWALLIGLALLFVANGFDLSDTFSWDGIQVLIRTWK